jgi:hypothetical protein
MGESEKKKGEKDKREMRVHFSHYVDHFSNLIGESSCGLSC